MKFVCDRCQTKYSIADEKVRGKILKVRCKSCTNIITVRDEGAGPGAGSGAAAARRVSAPAATVGAPAPRPPTPAAARAPLAPAPPPVERRVAARPEPPDDGVAWYMALDGNRTGPFSRKQLLDKVAPLSKDADLHVWSEKLGSWKPPAEVPALAHELAARRRPPTPVPPIAAAPPPPPPFPGAPRRPTGSSMPAVAAAPARQTGSQPVVGSPIGAGAGLKLPPPVAPPGGRRPTGPVARPAALAAAAASPAHAVEHGLDIDPSSMLETPAPQPHMLHDLGANGVGHAEPSVSNGASHGAEKSDILNTLNLASASGAGPAPRLLKSEAVVGYATAAAGQAADRQRAGRLIFVLLGVVGLCVVLFVTLGKKQPKPVVSQPAKATTDPLAGIVDNPPAATTPAPTPAPPPAAPTPAPEPPAAHGRGHAHAGAHGKPAGGAPTAPPPLSPAGTPAAPVAANDPNARYNDGHKLNITGSSGVSRPPPSQSEITRVIHNNMGGIKNCYQRALLRDSSLTHGKISVQVSIGISGRVKHTAIDGPPQFRALDPCIKEVVGHWAFPQAGDEYGTEFVYVFQGNE